MAKQLIVLSFCVFFMVVVVESSWEEMSPKMKELFEKICKEEKMDEAKLQAIESCRFKSFLDDYTPIRECEKKVFGEDKALDDLRKDWCKATPEEKKERMKSIRDCIMSNEAIRAKIMEKVQGMQGKSEEEMNQYMEERKKAVETCMETAYTA